MVTLGAILFGSAFGLCFRVWILLPASIAVIALTIISEAAGDASSLMIAGRSLLAVLALQAGYCMGLASRYVVIASRVPAQPKANETAKLIRLDRV